MINFDEFKKRLTKIGSPSWLNAYIDRDGHYWTATNGGMGNVSFNRIKSDHAFVGHIKKLIQEGSFTKEHFQHEYYAQAELARLLPIEYCVPPSTK